MRRLIRPFVRSRVAPLVGVVKGLSVLPGPARRVIGGPVADERERDPVRPVCHRAADDQALLAAAAQVGGVLPGCGIVEPQANTEIDERPAELDAALTADHAVASLAGGFVLDRVQPRAAIDLPRGGEAG